LEASEKVRWTAHATPPSDSLGLAPERNDVNLKVRYSLCIPYSGFKAAEAFLQENTATTKSNAILDNAASTLKRDRKTSIPDCFLFFEMIPITVTEIRYQSQIIAKSRPIKASSFSTAGFLLCYLYQSRNSDKRGKVLKVCPNPKEICDKREDLYQNECIV
jgi:hypothetical protein